jgi:hypothetical protein
MNQATRHIIHARVSLNKIHLFTLPYWYFLYPSPVCFQSPVAKDDHMYGSLFDLWSKGAKRNMTPTFFYLPTMSMSKTGWALLVGGTLFRAALTVTTTQYQATNSTSTVKRLITWWYTLTIRNKNQAVFYTSISRCLLKFYHLYHQHNLEFSSEINFTYIRSIFTIM